MNDESASRQAVRVALRATKAYPRNRAAEIHAPCVIEDDVVIGCNAVILPGIIVHAGAVIGAGSVVTRDVKAGVTVYGNPARQRLGHGR